MRVTISVTAARDLDQAEPDRIELSVAPERGSRRQGAQAQQQPSRRPCRSTTRNWLAVALLQEVRSEARCS